MPGRRREVRGREGIDARQEERGREGGDRCQAGGGDRCQAGGEREGGREGGRG